MKSLFTKVPLDYTINIILKRIYDDNELYTNISKKELKELLLLCTKNVHFTFNNEIYQQCDGLAMGYRWKIYGRIRKVINSNLDGTQVSLETICRRHYSSYKVIGQTAFTKILHLHMSWNKTVRLIFFRRYVD